MIIPPPGYWAAIEAICRKYDILLVSDEVICGFGRLGTWFGCEYFGFKPDLITFAKGVTSGYFPLGGVAVGDRVAEALVSRGGDFNHGFTYSGHPVGCAVALENIRLLESEQIIERVAAETSAHLNKRFLELLDHPLVGDAESCGMVAAILLMQDKKGRQVFPSAANAGLKCRAHCFNGGVIMRAVGHRMIAAPPLVITDDEIDLMMQRIRRALDCTLDELRIGGWIA